MCNIRCVHSSLLLLLLLFIYFFWGGGQLNIWSNFHFCSFQSCVWASPLLPDNGIWRWGFLWMVPSIKVWSQGEIDVPPCSMVENSVIVLVAVSMISILGWERETVMPGQRVSRGTLNIGINKWMNKWIIMNKYKLINKYWEGMLCWKSLCLRCSFITHFHPASWPFPSCLIHYKLWHCVFIGKKREWDLVGNQSWGPGSVRLHSVLCGHYVAEWYTAFYWKVKLLKLCNVVHKLKHSSCFTHFWVATL